MSRKILAAVLCVLALCGAASADFVYSNGTNLVRVKSDGTEEVTGIAGGDVFSFRHNGKAMMLVVHHEEEGYQQTGDIAVYDTDNLSRPVASGNINSASNGFEILSVAELGNNIVLGGHGINGTIIEVNPETCTVVNTYSRYNYPEERDCNSSVYSWNGLLIASFSWEYEDYYDEETVIMDTLRHITSNTGDFYIENGGWLEASGGELYVPIMADEPDDVEGNEGLYRVTELFRNGNMNLNDAVRLTNDNPNYIARDGNGGLYYSAYGTTTDSDGWYQARYIYHWDGSNSVRVYEAGTNSDISEITYDISNNTVYAMIRDDTAHTTYVAALTPDSSGQLRLSAQYTTFDEICYVAVIGNHPDSSTPSNDEAPSGNNSQSAASWLIYSNGTNIVRVAPDGTEEVTGIAAGNVYSFSHNGKAMILVASRGADFDVPTGSVSVYDLDDLTTPVASGNISSNGLAVNNVAELGNNIVLAGYSTNGTIIELNPETCTVVNTYSRYADLDTHDSEVYSWNGLLIASFESYSVEEDTFIEDTVIMDTFGHITGQLEGYSLVALDHIAASGGKLYRAFNGSDGLSGIYRISEAVMKGGNINISDFVKVESYNRQNANLTDITWDGNGGLYYVIEHDYIYH